MFIFILRPKLGRFPVMAKNNLWSIQGYEENKICDIVNY
jgi:hypothetical protein